MYITETTDNVRILFENIEELNNLGRMKFLLYLFNSINNNLINDKNELNPNLIENENLKTFNLESIGFENDYCSNFLVFNMQVYDVLSEQSLYFENGNVMGLIYNSEDKKIIKSFELLSFNEKLDVISEIIIKYDNHTYFKDIQSYCALQQNGYEIAKNIQRLKFD